MNYEPVGADVPIGPHDTKVIPLERADEDVGPYEFFICTNHNPPQHPVSPPARLSGASEGLRLIGEQAK